eukprot:SM000073S21400  [mRNA]  locus=s73:25888:27501:- [translate_table: standard]
MAGGPAGSWATPLRQTVFHAVAGTLQPDCEPLMDLLLGAGNLPGASSLLPDEEALLRTTLAEAVLWDRPAFSPRPSISGAEPGSEEEPAVAYLKRVAIARRVAASLRAQGERTAASNIAAAIARRPVPRAFAAWLMRQRPDLGVLVVDKHRLGDWLATGADDAVFSALRANAAAALQHVELVESGSNLLDAAAPARAEPGGALDVQDGRLFFVDVHGNTPSNDEKANGGNGRFLAAAASLRRNSATLHNKAGSEDEEGGSVNTGEDDFLNGLESSADEDNALSSDLDVH